MANHYIRCALLLAACAAGKAVTAQQSPGTLYDPVAAFAPLPHPPATATRAANGRPGPAYWQNHAAYKVAVTIDTLSRLVKGNLSVMYANNSPDTLTYIWLAAVQNRFRPDSRESLLTPPKGSRFGTSDHTEGLRIASLEANKQPATYSLHHNFIRVNLVRPLAPGKQVKLAIAYDYTLPLNGSDFMGKLQTPDGSVFQYSSMFPRVCVYDDLRGWNASGSQYYVEAGSVEMHFTAPANMLVQGTGTLLNPEEVLRPEVLRKYRQSLKSEAVVRVRSAGEPFAPEGAQTLTWKFREPTAGDGAWAASAAFHWDALATRLSNGTTVPAMALYPPASNREWDTIVRAMPRILKSYSDKWSPYPYTTAVNIAGGLTGIASPGISFIHYQQSSFGANVWVKTNHEIGHAWFNLMIAADSRIGWMCEGQNTLINLLSAAELGGEKAFDTRAALEWMTMKKKRVPIHTTFGSVPPADMGPLMYMKPALALQMLRNEVLGPERFDDAFRQYIHAWSYKHPGPHDFFRVMENAAGEDLAWFWRAWFLTDARLDQGLQGVEYDGKPENGLLVTLVNKQPMPMPVDLLVREFNGRSHRVRLPAQVWEWNGRHTLKVRSTSPVVAVLLDPESRLPDEDRSNNVWTGTGTKPLQQPISAQQVIDRYFAAIGGKARVEALDHASLEYRSWVDSVFVLRRELSPGGALSWSAALELPVQTTMLKRVEQADSLTFRSLGTRAPLTAVQAEEVRISAMLFPELRFGAPGNTVTVSDRLHFVHGLEAYEITLTTAAGNAWKLYYDAASGLKVRQEYAAKAKPLLYSSLVMAGYDEILGVKLPRQLTLAEDGTPEEVFELKKFSKS